MSQLIRRTRAYFNVSAGTFVPGEMKNVPGDLAVRAWWKCAKSHVRQCRDKKNFFACGGLSSVPEQFLLTIPLRRTDRKQVKITQTLVFQTNVIISSASGASPPDLLNRGFAPGPHLDASDASRQYLVIRARSIFSLKVRHSCKLWRTEFDIFTKNWSWILSSLARIHNYIFTQKLEVKGI